MNQKIQQLTQVMQQSRPVLADACGTKKVSDTYHKIDQKIIANKPYAMVYGAYNAGKSTLINALCGKKLAKTSDIPQTDSVSEYTWNDYTLLDTPGIDAPVAHEQISREQLKRCSLLIMVLRAGDQDCQRVHEEIISQWKNDKKMLLVINHTQPMNADNLQQRISQRDQLLAELQKYAAQENCDEMLAKLPIYEVNALSAEKAKIEQKNLLLQASGLPELEQQLHQWLGENQPSLASDLAQWLNHDLVQPALVQANEQCQNSDTAHKAQQLRQQSTNITQQRQQLLQIAGQKVDIQGEMLASQLPKLVMQQNQAQIEQLLSASSEQLLSHMQSELMVVLNNQQFAAIDLSDPHLQQLIAQAMQQAQPGNANAAADVNNGADWSQLIGSIGGEQLQSWLSSLGKVFKPGGPLPLPLPSFPWLKWIFAKLPILFTIATALHALYQSSQQEKQHKQQIARMEAQIQSVCQQLVEQAKNHWHSQLKRLVCLSFEPLQQATQQQLEQALQSLEPAQKMQQQLQQIQQQLAQI